MYLNALVKYTLPFGVGKIFESSWKKCWMAKEGFIDQ